MKLREVVDELRNMQALKAAIDRGEQPEITDAYYAAGKLGWGELEKLGYAKKHSEYTRDGANEWWTYTGPNAIVVVSGDHKALLKSGESTEPVYVDYT